ncbi:helix-turn-helix domain-containing protein, partial [Vibrio parahaemolyticus]|uniref:helix-turn-helix domain-containing protein n=1 Tax=Vibrio parahaemolyticus TaxID=670 RepID=UPI00201281EC
MANSVYLILKDDNQLSWKGINSQGDTMDWIQSVKSYIRVVEEGSFNAAARKPNTTSSAISKRVQWL